jgi:CRISPR-associated protein Cmr4
MSSQILERLVLVSDSLFPRIVNDNLEVRTSVAIGPATGAAEEGALFTYEAIPRATVMWFDIVYNKPEYFQIKVPKEASPESEEYEIQHGKASDQGWTWVRDNVEKGLTLIEHLGIGGMGTRGMGRVRILN